MSRAEDRATKKRRERKRKSLQRLLSVINNPQAVIRARPFNVYGRIGHYGSASYILGSWVIEGAWDDRGFTIFAANEAGRPTDRLQPTDFISLGYRQAGLHIYLPHTLRHLS